MNLADDKYSGVFLSWYGTESQFGTSNVRFVPKTQLIGATKQILRSPFEFRVGIELCCYYRPVLHVICFYRFLGFVVNTLYGGYFPRKIQL